MVKSTATPSTTIDKEEPKRTHYRKNRGIILSVSCLAGSFGMAAQGYLANVGSYRLVRGVLDGTFSLFWLSTLSMFLLRPAMNRYSSYARFAAAAGIVILGFAAAYGFAASWYNTGYVFFAGFVITGIVIARIPGIARWAGEIGFALALVSVDAFAHGLRNALSHSIFVLFPLALSEAAGRTIERIRLEGEISLRDLKSRNEELEELAYRDPLTQLYNRRYGFESLRKSISFVRRYGGELHILVLDIDRFKKVNDELGHPVGDSVLKDLAKILMETLRDSDIAARIGGEEFLVILPRTRSEAAQGVANRIRDSVAHAKFESVPWRVTVSVGVTSLRGDDTPESLFSRADMFLYDSKRSGRNRVTGS